MVGQPVNALSIRARYSCLLLEPSAICDKMRKRQKHKMTKYIFVTGGVVSSLGKGIAAASLAAQAVPLQVVVISRVSVFSVVFFAYWMEPEVAAR